MATLKLSKSFWLLSIAAALIFFARGTELAGAQDVTPAEWLDSQVAPTFRPHNLMPPLTRYGWSLPFDARVSLAKRWGYALEFGEYASTKSVGRALTQPSSDEARAVRLAIEEPDKFKLSIILPRDMPELTTSNGWLKDAAGRTIRPKSPVWNPAADNKSLLGLIKMRTEPIEPLLRKVKPFIILNGGEYGIGPIGSSKKLWERDPRIIAARGELSWYEYISKMKAKEQIAIRHAVQKLAPNSIYVYYTNGGGTHNDRYRGWQNWTFSYPEMRGAGSFPSDEYYFAHFNDGFIRDARRKSGGKGDMLTQALNAKGAEIAAGDLYSYDWVSGGWSARSSGGGTDGPAGRPSTGDNAKVADPRVYGGFLKCLYLAGTMGANSGYYSYPLGGFGRKFPKDHPPPWLQQLVTVSRVHALFSYLEPFTRNSTLLPGTRKHEWGRYPAYELETSDPNVRALARQFKDKSMYLLVVWAPTSPGGTNVSVSLSGLTTLNLVGDSEGRIYLVRGQGDRYDAEEVNRENADRIMKKNLGDTYINE
ncbi:hypothetical protein NKH86_27665 [Mesorhizobium sp. M0913]|uniref:hypothetical protein n=1 Tax=Mesorhizobium sp. M0913 TaxID=2957026 RepID=UPI00333D2EF9